MKTELTPLEKAKQYKLKGKVSKVRSKEELDLAFAWVSGEVTTTQVQRGFGVGTKGSVYCRLAQLLRQAHNQKMLKIVKTE